jgi:hypothetical protein
MSTFSNAEKEGTMYQEPACGRQAKYKVGIRIGIEFLVFKDLARLPQGTLYLVLRTTFSVLLLDTFSNVER